MAITEFDPGRVLGSKIAKMSRQELCEFTSVLCGRIMSEVGTRGRRGGIYPDNISVDEDGNIGLGPVGTSPWSGEELNFLAPELYWNGQAGAVSDVYSVGLLLYYAVSGGKLPLEGQCKDAQLRRMGGDNFSAPRSAGRRLGEIIEKAIRFRASERYQTLEELRVVLDSCVKNLYLSGIPSAEAIFKKNDDDLSDLERMMVGIIEKNDAGAPAEEEREEPVEEPAVEPEDERFSIDIPGVPPVRSVDPELLRVKAPAAPAVGLNAGQPAPAEPPVRRPKPVPPPAAPRAPAAKGPELRPVEPVRQSEKTVPAQYSKNIERERKISEEVKKRRRRPLAVILVLCALLVIVAIIFNAMLKDFQEASLVHDNTIEGMDSTPPVDPYAGTAAPQQSADAAGDPGAAGTAGAVGGLQGIPEEVAATPVAHSYEVFVEDVSWTEARDRCYEKGGHLVVISNVEEFERVVNLAEAKNVSKVWIGCHRVDGELIWEKDEAGYFDWAKGEPTYVDVNDNVAENYVMLWNNNGTWAYNDNRNDPIADYPQMYSGTVGYVCEYGD